MDRFLRPERFDTDPNTQDSADTWEHWLCTFSNFLDSIASHSPDKLKMLFNYVAPCVYRFIKDCKSYECAIVTLREIYVQPKNEIFARHLLNTCKQDGDQNLDQFVQKRRSLLPDCHFTAVNAEQHSDEALRDAFIGGLHSNIIRQRLLEHKSLDFKTAYDHAKSLELAQKQSQSFLPNNQLPCATVSREQPRSPSSETSSQERSTVASIRSPCFFCGYARHPRDKCPAKDAICKNCGKKGHFQKVCRSATGPRNAASVLSALSRANAASPECLKEAVTDVLANGVQLRALVDTGSSESFISEKVVRHNKWSVLPSSSVITLASTQHKSFTLGHCFLSLQHNQNIYPSFRLSVLRDLCADILLGHDFLKLHKSVKIPFKGDKPSFSLCGLIAAQIEPLTLFAHLDPNCKPVAIKSRRHSSNDEVFIASEVKRLLEQQIIEPSKSPWRAQVLVTTNERQKKRMVIDYSQTINRFTHLDAYPLPRIDDMSNKIAKYRIFSTLDLESAYHQIPIKESDRIYTAFEACSNLYQFSEYRLGSRMA